MDTTTQTGSLLHEKTMLPGATSGSPAGEVIIRKQSTGWDLLSFPVHIMQATDICSYYIRLNDAAPWTLYVTAAAGDVVVLRGRWHAIRCVLAAGPLYVRADAGWTAWS